MRGKWNDNPSLRRVRNDRDTICPLAEVVDKIDAEVARRGNTTRYAVVNEILADPDSWLEDALEKTIKRLERR